MIWCTVKGQMDAESCFNSKVTFSVCSAKENTYAAPLTQLSQPTLISLLLARSSVPAESTGIYRESLLVAYVLQS